MKTSRPYSMTVRAARAAATRQRILDAAQALYDARTTDVTLDAVATAAEVSVQTVLRIFGSKDALLVEAVGSLRQAEQHRAVMPGSIVAAVRGLFDDYEAIGDRVIGILADEHRIAGFAAAAAAGRRGHRHWAERVFAPYLPTAAGGRRERALVALIAATDVYVWKLLRRDMGLSRDEAEVIVRGLCEAAISAVANEE